MPKTPMKPKAKKKEVFVVSGDWVENGYNIKKLYFPRREYASVDVDFADLSEILQDLVENGTSGESFSVKIVEMTQKQIDNIPEAD